MRTYNQDKKRKRKRKGENPLYVLTDLGYVETGYTEERLDREVTRGDRLLLLLDELRHDLELTGNVTALNKIREVLRGRDVEVEAAKTRTGKKR